MTRDDPGIEELARRHLGELRKAIDAAVRSRADWKTILALRAAARAYRGVLGARSPAPSTPLLPIIPEPPA